MSVTRSVNVGSNRTIQLRVDVQNLLNRQHWRDANTDPTSTNFGRVTTVSPNFMRFVTFAMKLNF
jgi:outer membrane receptor protein involved in Fe transport